ncbi:unnamed protein product [Linum trigynum]|uniref:Retrotransposon gag domain-containing protein n=1 Tax=Linum trigynum TaxID=586398 RepID=A0AAV2ES15_9ROSI
MVLFFQCGHYTEQQKVALATFEFTDYAAQWWEQTRLRRQRNLHPEVTDWEELRGLMRDRFVMAYYQRELHESLQAIRQEGRSVDEYFRELELLLMRTDVREDREATIARFLHGMNREITQEVDLRSFVDLEDALHLS